MILIILIKQDNDYIIDDDYKIMMMMMKNLFYICISITELFQLGETTEITTIPISISQTTKQPSAGIFQLY